MPLCSISVDLDEIACYSAIHGLAQCDDSNAVYDVALPRIRDFAATFGFKLTLFVVARDLRRERNRDALKLAIANGHEIGNHSLDHLHDLTRRNVALQTRQVADANNQIETMLGVRPRGFRAPGYTMTDTLMNVLTEVGLSYDSSVFPCPAYYGLKAAVLMRMKFQGRQSTSILGDRGALRAPTTPYRTGKSYWRSGSGMLEFPIQVVGPLRVPFIGTTLTALGATGARLLTRALDGTPFINLELHGVDFLEAVDVPQPMLAVQPDLRIPFSRKINTLAAVMETLRSRGYAPVRLDEAMREWPRS